MDGDCAKGKRRKRNRKEKEIGGEEELGKMIIRNLNTGGDKR